MRCRWCFSEIEIQPDGANLYYARYDSNFVTYTCELRSSTESQHHMPFVLEEACQDIANLYSWTDQ
jgi:hypothetical protein